MIFQRWFVEFVDRFSYQVFLDFSNQWINNFKGSSDPSNLIFESMSERGGLTTLKSNNEFLDPLKIDWRFKFRVVLCRIRIFPLLISKIKWLGCGLTSMKNYFLGALFYENWRSICFAPSPVLPSLENVPRGAWSSVLYFLKMDSYFSLSLRSVSFQKFQHQRNWWRVPYLDNAICPPSKMKPV